MHSLSLLLFVVVLVIVLYTEPISSKPVKQGTTTPEPVKPNAATTKSPGKVPAAKPASKVVKKKNPEKKSKKPKKDPWKAPNADQKKLFNDYKAIIRTKLLARSPNIPATYQLEPAKHGSIADGQTILHHFLIKLPDSKYAHAIIGTNKDPKKPSPINESNASIRRTIYDNLAAAAA